MSSGLIFTYLPGPHRPIVPLCTSLYHCTQLDQPYIWYLDKAVACLVWVGCATSLPVTGQAGLKDAQQIPSSSVSVD